MTGRHETDVAIRPWSDGDLPLMERLLGDPAMTRHLGGPESPERLRERHERYCAIGDTGTGRMFVIVVDSDRVAVGSIGYWEREWQGQVVWETGWSVLPEVQGRGIATRTILLAIARARADGKHRFMHAFPSVENAPSNAICRKAGFTLRAAFDSEYPPGNPIRCNDWSLDLFAGDAAAPSP